jgi:hypothetical protein
MDYKSAFYCSKDSTNGRAHKLVQLVFSNMYLNVFLSMFAGTKWDFPTKIEKRNLLWTKQGNSVCKPGKAVP